jgi:hypothetical protein
MYIIITMLRNPIHSQAYINIEITHNIIILSLQIRQPTISLEMPVPSQGHYGVHSFPVVD